MPFRVESTDGGSAQRGQVLVLFALMAIVIIGSGALAIDLSAQSNAHRILQNWTDAAAISGVRDCATSCNAKKEVQDSIQVVLQNSPWSSVSTWATSAPIGACNAASCVVTAYSGPSGFTNYTVSISSPPANPRNSNYNSTSYVEVDVSESNTTGLAGLLGASSTTSAGHSVAFSSGVPGPYQYTFFSKKQAGSGNQVESIIGDAFVGDGYSPQSSGKSALCISEVPGPEPSSDSDGDPGGAPDNDVDDQGHVVFGVAPPTVGPEPSYATTCPSGNGKGVLAVEQTSPSAGNCPVNATPTRDSSTGAWLCVQANPSVPNIPAPATTKPALGCGATVDGSTAPGVYPVPAGCKVTIDPVTQGNVDCVSLVLGPGSTVDVANKKGAGYISSYGFNPTGDTTATNAIKALPATPPTGACGGAGVGANNAVIWAPDPGSSGPMPMVLTNGSTGCCSDTLFIGTVFLPDQVVSFSTNQAMEDVGSVYAGDWQVQSGNHPNPVVSYDANAAAPLPPSLRLTE
jgi:Flp pilus assembly protein TadG